MVAHQAVVVQPHVDARPVAGQEGEEGTAVVGVGEEDRAVVGVGGAVAGQQEPAGSAGHAVLRGRGKVYFRRNRLADKSLAKASPFSIFSFLFWEGGRRARYLDQTCRISSSAAAVSAA